MLVMQHRGSGAFVMLALMAFSLIVAVVIASSYARQSADDRRRSEVRQGEEERFVAVKLNEIVASALKEAAYEATEEVAAHGGYRRELVPPISFEQIPYWFHGGRVIQVPSTELMRSMLEDEVDSRLREQLEELEKRPEYAAVHLRTKDIEVRTELGDTYVGASATVVLTHDGPTGPQRQTYTPSVVLELRLKFLRDISEQAIGLMVRNESVERHFIYFMRQDPRFPIPEGLPEITCREEFVHKRNLIAPMEEDLKLAISQTLVRLRTNESLTGREAEVLWRMSPVRPQIDLTFVDYFGNRDLIHKWVARRTYPCIRSWQAWYNFTMPTLISVVDLRKTAKVLLGQEVSAAAGLTFNVLYLGEVRENQIYRSTTADMSEECLGACTMKLTVLGSGDDVPIIDGAYMDVCDMSIIHSFPSSFRETMVENVPCGHVRLSATPADTDTYFLSTRLIELREHVVNNITVRLTAAASLKGQVLKRSAVMCNARSATGCKNIILDRGSTQLSFVRGSPERYISLLLASLDEPGLRYSAVIDEGGDYSFPHIRSGWYILAAVPSMDDVGNVGYRVVPSTERLLIRPGENEHQVVMRPVTPVVKDGATVLVDNVERCERC